MEHVVGHKIEARWREADATALDERVRAIGEWLEHTEDLVAMLEDDEKTATELRGLAGTLRSRRNDFNQRADGLRAQLVGQDDS